MPRYKLMATEYVYKDAIVEASSEEEALAKAEADELEWITVGGDWEIHKDMTFKETDDD